MAKSPLHVATIVGSSTDSAWSQTYHAGGVTAIVSVERKEGQEDSSLSLVGKDLLNTFESEYFTLENKNLASIKDAVELTYNKSKETHKISLLVSSVIQNAVYVVLAGPGKILLIRKGHLATLLEQTEEAVQSASGFLEPGDILILETPSFEEKIPSDKLFETLSSNSVSDTAEILSPTIHKEKDGAASALFFAFETTHHEALPTIAPMPVHEEKHEKVEPEREKQIEASESAKNEPVEEKPEKKDEDFVIHAPAPEHKQKKRLFTHRQKIFLTIAIILAIVLAGAVYFSLQKKQTTQYATLFNQIYPPAERKFEEGQGLQDLNPSLAHDDFTQAQQMLEAAKRKFPADSQEEKQVLALLDKVNAQLSSGTAAPKQTTNVTKVDTSTSPFLAFAQKHSDTKYVAQDATNFYFADDTGITRVNKSTDKTTQIIKNGGDWKTLGGFQTYLGNMYVLDTMDGIDKYPVTASGFGDKAAYFTGATPDLSKAVSLAIDGSLWVLTSDGTISKYTKGKQDDFTVSGMTQKLSSPTQIVTTVDDDNMYILDNGNSRLVVLKKDGTFVAEYVNAQLKSATQLDVNEAGKNVYFLSGGNVYQMDLK